MDRSRAKQLLALATTLTGAALLVACGGTRSFGDDSFAGDPQALGECAFAVQKNVYDGPNWWGTITVKNSSGSSVSGIQIAFDVPNGVTCDDAESSWSYAQTGVTCTYTKASGSIGAGRTLTLHYSTNAQSFSAVTNIRVMGAGCGGQSPVGGGGAAGSSGGGAGGSSGSADAGAVKPKDAGLPPTVEAGAGGSDGQQTGGTTLAWRKASLTEYESYPDPGSEECIRYNGCEYLGEFAALDEAQTKEWVKAHNIASVHSKDFKQYKLKTLRLRKNSREIDVTVYDECADSDCGGCCTANAKPSGFLIDIEKYTAERFGVPTEGQVDWACLDCK